MDDINWNKFLEDFIKKMDELIAVIGDLKDD